jgi:hypothetical protein
MRQVRYPAKVELVPGAMKAGDAHKALGISRGVALHWRRKHGMPASDRHGLIDSAALAKFLIERGTRIIWT